MHATLLWVSTTKYVHYLEGAMPKIRILKKEGRHTIREDMSVPESEILILEVIGQKKMTAPMISKESNGAITIKEVYKLLSRLVVRRLLDRETTYFEVTGTELRRVMYSAKYVSFEVL